MNNISDGKQRERALDISRSFIVQAPAGSGKTELLTRRVLRLLAVVEKPESILAITFTRKAASEMLDRVLGALREAAEPITTKTDRERWNLAVKALRRDKEFGWNLLENPGRLRVSTIDSLSAALVRQMPFLSRLGAPPAIVEDATELYRDAARRTLGELESKQEWAAQVERTLIHLANDWGQVENLLIEMLGRRDQWLRHLTTNDKADLEKGLGEAIKSNLQRALDRAPKDIETHLARVARNAAALVPDPESPINDLRDFHKYPEALAANLPHWKGLASLLLTEKGDWRARLTKNEGFPKPGDAKDLLMQLLDHCKSKSEGWREALKALRDSPPSHYAAAQWEIVEALATTLKLSALHLQRVFAERSQADFVELSRRALQALEGPDGPTDLAFVLDGRIEHILMDEFQDTSFTQYLLLHQLTYGWSAGENRSIFLVGDPMQSIYRFREAEVGLFLDAWKHGIGGVPLEPLTLAVNFRSQGGIVEWVNNTFSGIFPTEPDQDWGAVPYSPSVAQNEKLSGRAVHMHPFLIGDEDAEADCAVALACAAASEKKTTVAILVRARDHAIDITRKLQARGQRYQAVELDLLKDRPAVRDLDALLKALLFPANRVAWLAILRAPWCGLKLTELEALVGGNRKETVLELLRNFERSARLERTFQVLEEALGQRRRRPLARWLEDTWLALGGAATLAGEGHRQDASRYLEFVHSFDKGGDIENLGEFNRALEKLYAKPDPQADGRLQIMTMHKAKGLEFDVVILPGLGKTSGSDGNRLLYWLERAEGNAGSVVLAPSAETGAEKDAISDYIRSVEKRRTKHEDARLLYVAATRAKRELHLIGAVDKNGNAAAKSALHTLWPAVSEAFRSPLQLNLLGRLEPSGVHLLERFCDGWQTPARPHALPWIPDGIERQSEEITFDWSGLALRWVGTVVHRYLEQIGHEGISLWPAQRMAAQRADVMTQLRSLGVPADEIDATTAKVEQAIVETLTDSRGRWILTDHEEARSEWALTGEFGPYIRSIQMDRTFIDDAGTRWIIDFKTSTHAGGDVEAFLDNERLRYEKQLESYAVLVSRLDPRPIKLGLYFPLLKGWRAWSFERAESATGQ